MHNRRSPGRPVQDRLSALSRNLLENFKEKAMHWGHQQDVGFGEAVEPAKNQYEEAYKALADRILTLEQEVKRLRRTVRLFSSEK